jgi:hypothetical protein
MHFSDICPRVTLSDGPDGVKFSLEKIRAVLQTVRSSSPCSFGRFFPLSTEIGTKLNVHFDGPKMDEKGPWLPEKDLTFARAPLKFIQLARHSRAQT